MGKQQPAVRLKGITKRFGEVLANDHVDFEVMEGEIHALLGENGAGKTTLMSILYGLCQPDEGEIVVFGKTVPISNPRDAIACGIGMVHQHFMLVPELTVAENLILGMPERSGLFFDPAKICKEIEEISRGYGFEVNPRDYVWTLPVGVQERVEILKALYRGARILILDEPTAVLTPQEVEELFKTLRVLVSRGHSIILITHKLDEVMEISDRVTVMRHGRIVKTVNTKDTTPSELARLMVGRDVNLPGSSAAISGSSPSSGPRRNPILTVKDLRVQSDRGYEAVRGVSFEVGEGEIFGIAGVDGNGQVELGECLVGLKPASGGKVFLEGRDITNLTPGALIKRGVGHIPEDRQKKGLVLQFPVAYNLILGSHRRKPFARGRRIDFSAVEENARRLIAAFDIRTPGAGTPARNLSGGNQQKVVLARELSRDPKVLVALGPTRGLDVGATEYVRRKLAEERSRGKAVILISTELEEVMELSDRIAIMYKGQFAGVVGRGTPKDVIGRLMLGAGAGEVALAIR
ncbi:MAG TPA: ABC transporter ATP-binding protein [Clostridia bacterium]|nr:ABC transporter ATP-binding protein [Clostridia bacterium]